MTSVVGLLPPAGDEHDDGPADADQQAVRTGHVRHGERRVGEILAGRPREVQIDGVLGQHAHQREHEDGEGLGDVALGQLRGPREQEGAAQDRHAGERRDELRSQRQAGEVMAHHPRDRQRTRRDQEQRSRVCATACAASIPSEPGAEFAFVDERGRCPRRARRFWLPRTATWHAPSRLPMRPATS